MSWRLALIRSGMRLSRTKRRWNSAELTRANVERLASRRRPTRPARLWTRGTTVSESRSGCETYTLTPRDSEPARRVVFLHGGGYIREISAVHWQFAAQLARDVPAVVDVPLYPLAPSATAGTTVPLIADLVHDIALTHGGPVALVGDSAGGGLAFAAAVVLRDTQRSSVSNLVLFSPWLDLTLSDPRLVDLDRQDLTIGIAGGREAARMYSGELALDDPLASPLLGRVDGLPPIDVFAGTHDLISVDSVRLQQRCEAVDQTCRLRLVDEMPHVFPILPLLREAACARAEVVDLLRR